MASAHLASREPSLDWDLWAFVVIAFEMLVGRRPFVAGPAGPPRFDGLVPADLPPALCQLFARALAAEPLVRPTTAREFLDELDRAVMCEAAP